MKEGGRCYEVSAETRRENCAYTTVYSPRSAATGERQRASCLLGFRCESAIIDSRSKSTIRWKLVDGMTRFLVGGRLGNGRMGLQVDDGGAETSHREDLVTSTVLGQVLIRFQVKDGVFDGNRRNNWSTCQWSAPMRTKGKRCGGRVKTMTHLVPVDRATPKDGALVNEYPD